MIKKIGLFLLPVVFFAACEVGFNTSPVYVIDDNNSAEKVEDAEKGKEEVKDASGNEGSEAAGENQETDEKLDKTGLSGNPVLSGDEEAEPGDPTEKPGFINLPASAEDGENYERPILPEDMGNPFTPPEEEGEGGSYQEEDDEPGIPVNRTWTYIVYMAADNSLESYAIKDINEMEAGIANDKTVSVLALLDRHPGYDSTNKNWNDTRLYEIKPDAGGMNGTIVSKRLECPDLDITKDGQTELDMGNRYTLAGVLDYARREYEAEHYVLIVWGHGSGWRGYAYDGSSDTSLSLPSLRKATMDKGLDAVVFDSCFGLTAETIYELNGCCKYVGGTGGLSGTSGIDYRLYFNRFFECNRSEASMIRTMTNYAGTEISMFDCEETLNMVDAINNFGGAMAEYISTKDIQKQILDDCLNKVKIYSSSSYPCDAYIDVADMAKYMQKYEPLRATGETLENVLNRGLITSGNASVSVHLIPFVQKKVAASGHSELYIKDYSNNYNGTERCSFVNYAEYWVPTGKNQSFLDALFYRVF